MSSHIQDKLKSALRTFLLNMVKSLLDAIFPVAVRQENLLPLTTALLPLNCHCCCGTQEQHRVMWNSYSIFFCQVNVNCNSYHFWISHFFFVLYQMTWLYEDQSLATSDSTRWDTIKLSPLQNPQPRCKLESLNHPGVAAAFRFKVGGRFSALDLKFHRAARAFRGHQRFAQPLCASEVESCVKFRLL